MMHAFLVLLLLLAGLPGTPSTAGPAVAPAVAQDPAPLAAVAYGDCLDFLLMLQDPAVASVVLDVVDRDGTSVAAVLHTAVDDEGEACTWIGLYVFPSSIFAHSVVSVPLHAEEMD
jgi:hypothetical protein